MKVADTFKQAEVSGCGLYRPWLSRQTTEVGKRRTAFFVLNNPSTADDLIDDPTVVRGWNFTESWGLNKMVFGNTNSYRATRPADRKKMSPKAAAWNSAVLLHFAKHAEIVICAWGDKADPLDAKCALQILLQSGKPLHHLGTLTKAGNPRHILYLKGDLQPKVFS